MANIATKKSVKKAQVENQSSWRPLTDEELAARIEKLTELKEKLQPKVRSELVLVTPSMAKKWLEKNYKNRDSKTRGNLYGRIMADDLWDFNGQPIIISDTGLLLDGGGRCAGIVKSNTAQLVMVTTGIPEEAFKTMDAIKARTAKDRVEASHLLDGEKTSVIGYVATMGKFHLEWLAGRYGSHGGANTRPTACSLEVQDYIERNLDKMRECAKAGLSMHGGHRESLMTNGRYFSNYIGYLVICKGWDLSDVIPFFDALTDRESKVREYGNPIATLREYLSKDKDNKIKKITDEQRFHMFARAWNSYCLGLKLKQFKLEACKEVPMDKSEYLAFVSESPAYAASMAM